MRATLQGTRGPASPCSSGGAVMTIPPVFNSSSNVWLLFVNLSNHTSSLYNTWIWGFFHYYQSIRELCSTWILGFLSLLSKSSTTMQHLVWQVVSWWARQQQPAKMCFEIFCEETQKHRHRESSQKWLTRNEDTFGCCSTG